MDGFDSIDTDRRVRQRRRGQRRAFQRYIRWKEDRRARHYHFSYQRYIVRNNGRVIDGVRTPRGTTPFHVWDEWRHWGFRRAHFEAVLSAANVDPRYARNSWRRVPPALKLLLTPHIIRELHREGYEVVRGYNYPRLDCEFDDQPYGALWDKLTLDERAAVLACIEEDPEWKNDGWNSLPPCVHQVVLRDPATWLLVLVTGQRER